MTEKPKLLIVEDDAGLQRQLRWAYDGYEILTATNREEAIAAIRADEPPVVTLDLGLPPDHDGTTEGFATLQSFLLLREDT
jgi:two-component system NtrC family response regulator